MSSASHASRHRMAASLLIAAVVHLGVLASLDWPSPPHAEPVPAIQLVLTSHRTSPRQQDTGSAAAAPAQRAPSPSPTQSATKPAPVAQSPAPVAAPTDDLFTDRSASFAGRSAWELARAIASSARQPTPFDAERRTLRLADGAPASPDFAYYLRSWRRKIERIGQLNYPQQAKRQGIGGSLRLLVVISADGALHNVRILESSGHRLLDDAALHIVRLAAPYAPFSPAMREAADVLEIERTWQFRNSRLSF